MTATPTPCPACRQPMSHLTLPKRDAGHVDLDLCFPCQGIWFDNFESYQISPGGIIELFKLIHAHRDEMRMPHPVRLHCPRCNDALLPVLDVAKSGRFTYQRCLQKHGRFTVFAQFMIEKGFVRQLAPMEVKALAARVGTIHCSGCGAPAALCTRRPSSSAGWAGATGWAAVCPGTWALRCICGAAGAAAGGRRRMLPGEPAGGERTRPDGGGHPGRACAAPGAGSAAGRRDTRRVPQRKTGTAGCGAENYSVLTSGLCCGSIILLI